jgi:hypothetical protein
MIPSLRTILLGACLVTCAGSLFAGEPDSSVFRPHPVSGLNPWTRLTFPREGRALRFAVLPDVTGGYREGMLPDVVGKLNLLQPGFVVTTGDLIEGYTREESEARKWWSEFTDEVDRLQCPFFFVPGNHDISNPLLKRLWIERFGRTYYHFVHENTLFLCLNSLDADGEGIGAEQIRYFENVLRENPAVRWTFVFMHHPLWTAKRTTGFEKIEASLASRPYTVFAGHTHQYRSYVRNGRDYIVVGTAGGFSALRGAAIGELDHVMMVTLRDSVPVIASIDIGGIRAHTMGNERIAADIDALVDATSFTILPFLAENEEFREGVVTILLHNHGTKALDLEGMFDDDERIQTSPSTIRCTVQAGGSLRNDIRLRAVNDRVHLREPLTLQFRWKASSPGGMPALEGERLAAIVPVIVCRPPRAKIVVDGSTAEWGSFPFNVTHPGEVGYVRSTWHGHDDGWFEFNVAADDRYLYIAANVNDDSVNVQPLREVCEQDGLEFTLDPRTSSARAGEKRFRPVKVSFAPARSDGGQRLEIAGIDTTGVLCASHRNSHGYTFEIAIPMSTLGHAAGSPVKEFRLNAALFDHDGSESQYRGTLLRWMPEWGSDVDVPGSGSFVLGRSQ